MREIRATGAGQPETSYYPALSSLLNELGNDLKPKVRCVINLKNRGAGMPDGGLFTKDQFGKDKEANPFDGQVPSRGVLEAKAVSDDSWVTAEGEQVTRYWGKYQQVLVTNFRDFVLVGRGADGRPRKLETFRLAKSEKEFWAAAANPRATANGVEQRFVEYLKRVLLHAAPLVDPKDLAWFLASYARDAAARIEDADLPALLSLRSALEESLGLKFEGEKGEHFFRSTLIQTLFYGVFSAWVLWCREMKREQFEWRIAGWTLHVPMIRALFEQIATPAKLEPLGLVEVLDWTAAALNRVDQKEFFQRFEDEHAVPYFYEPFLAAFDPGLRKQLGVWYTPPEIVQYMVERVDRVLREELSIRDGLADPRVFVLDPACGTGAYLVEVLKRIAKTRSEKGAGALLAADVKKAARERVFGFEILPAPFVVSHLQIGLYLSKIGSPLEDAGDERAAVFLTNALTGWEPPREEKKPLIFPELAEERDAADHVKRDTPILVILGNPPYNAFAGVSPKEEEGLVEPYKKGLVKEWGIKKFNLDDLYVRFFRLAERKIAEMKPFRGVVSFISNHSWIREPSFVVLRKHLLLNFDRFWIENMHGNRKISEYAPDGRTSETIFAIQGQSVGIQQGVAISLWVKSGKERTPKVLFRDDHNAAKAVERRAQLLTSLSEKPFDDRYVEAKPTKDNRFSFRPESVSSEYSAWPTIESFADFKPSLGILENRKEALIDIDREPLEDRMRAYFDRGLSWNDLKSQKHGLVEDAARFDSEKTFKLMRDGEAHQFHAEFIRKLLVRPMDLRWCYYVPTRPIWNEPRTGYATQCWPGNSALVTRRKGVAEPEGIPFFFTSALGFQHSMNTDAYFVPLKLRISREDDHVQGRVDIDAVRSNLSLAARRYLNDLPLTRLDSDPGAGSMLWFHSLAIGCSPLYLSENADGIRQDWPRIPLPASKDAFLASAGLGSKIAALLNTEPEIEGVTTGTIRPELAALGVISRAGGGQLDAKRDLAVTAGWGHAGKGGVTMPGKGKVFERDFSKEELASLGSAAELLGPQTCDIFVNDGAYWKNVPIRAWEYFIGGYQVLKKWLSYRENELLGRDLTPEEVREVTNMVRRLAALVLLEPELDENYRRVTASTYPWQTS